MAGSQFHVGAVDFEGVTGIPLDSLRVEAALGERGAIYRGGDIDACPRAIADTIPARRLRDGSRRSSSKLSARPRNVDVVFAVSLEGPRQVINEITIDGLRQVAGDVARRALRLKTGDPLRTADWLEARRRLFESGLFRRVDITYRAAGGNRRNGAGQVAGDRRGMAGAADSLRFQVEEERPEENVKGRDASRIVG